MDGRELAEGCVIGLQDHDFSAEAAVCLTLASSSSHLASFGAAQSRLEAARQGIILRGFVSLAVDDTRMKIAWLTEGAPFGRHHTTPGT